MMRCRVILILNREKSCYRQSQELKTRYAYFCIKVLHDDAFLFYLTVLFETFQESLPVLVCKMVWKGLSNC